MKKKESVFLPLLTVCLLILLLWYAFAVYLNATWQINRYEKADKQWNASELVRDTLQQERPVLPAAHQVLVELWQTTVNKKITSKRSLVYHGWITLSATSLGFIIGTLLGIMLSVFIVHSITVQRALMPWIIASQTIPILAIAPMIIVVMNAIGFSGILPKALVSAYLSFFPVVVGMVRGLRSADQIQFDLMKTYHASESQIFWLLRLPRSLPFFFASLKIAIATSLVGAIIGELPTGAVAGLGARLLAGSYYGQTIQIWAALFAAATLAAALVAAIGIISNLVLKRMGMSA
ncbi:MAG: ABC transporter permease [Proteobacteria bacterium]|nr:ABC transporter permease [Pseudomonadota bacterium]